ncbi:MAG TPA: ABC transporter permease subunit, partial [Thermoanaerobaculia bacterium]|nr:ABC transporter permease subunit [Thermoanaerobaculia bacterium]
MFKAISTFEVRYQLRQPLFYAVTLLLALMTFGAVTSDTVQIGGSIGNVHRNAPLVIMRLLGAMTLIGMFVTTAFVASSAQRDFEHGTHSLFFSKPLNKRDYLLGRFFGSVGISALVFLGPTLGILIGTFMPWLEPERLGPFTLAPYLYTFLIFVIPNLVFTGAVFFTLASVTRSLLYTYLGVVVLFIGYIITQSMLRDVENV